MDKSGKNTGIQADKIIAYATVKSYIFFWSSSPVVSRVAKAEFEPVPTPTIRTVCRPRGCSFRTFCSDLGINKAYHLTRPASLHRYINIKLFLYMEMNKLNGLPAGFLVCLGSNCTICAYNL